MLPVQYILGASPVEQVLLPRHPVNPASIGLPFSSLNRSKPYL